MRYDFDSVFILVDVDSQLELSDISDYCLLIL